jgi:hypothetical protein
MSKKTTKKGTKQELDARCARMLAAALPHLAERSSVRFKDVREVYHEPNVPEKTLKSRFAGDLKRLVQHWPSLSRMLSHFGYFLPEFVVQGSELKVTVRPFSRRLLGYGQDHPKQKLARLLVQDRFNNDLLVPRDGSLFLGYGTTLYFVAQEILKRQPEFSELSVYTPNFEVASLFYLFAEQAAHLAVPLRLPGCTVNWNTGSISRAGGLASRTAVVGCDFLTRSGNCLPTTRKRCRSPTRP